jgi:ribosomal protein S18 acetylase RimI-like enzyme
VIRYSDSLAGVTAQNLTSFFVGWPNPANAETHFHILQGSYKIWLAFDENRVVGFITAISDGVLAAFIPLLEVLPEYQGQGIGLELTRRMLDSLKHLYSIDLICDEELQPFYEKIGMRPYSGMIYRYYENQAGAIPKD